MTLKIFDFYSGLGGFHTAMYQIAHEFEIIEAFDMNINANLVYTANHNIKPSIRNISFLKKEDIDAKASLWLLSPPCQPYSRKNRNGHKENDSRSDSFIHLLSLLLTLDSPPSYLMLENVLGFESSQVFGTFEATLSSCGYSWQGFQVNPKDHGFPYSRPRLFILAKKGQFIHHEYTSQIQACPDKIISLKEPMLISEFIDAEAKLEIYAVPIANLWKAGLHFDIITPVSTRSCCFTKAYASYAKGGGSILATTDYPIDPCIEKYKELYALKQEGEWWAGLECPFAPLGLRYFSPLEIARLHGFPSEFLFPEATTIKQRYKLLGNSLHVTMVQHLLSYLLKE